MLEGGYIPQRGTHTSRPHLPATVTARWSRPISGLGVDNIDSRSNVSLINRSAKGRTMDYMTVTHSHYYDTVVSEWQCRECDTCADYCQQINPS